ncbi:MAG: ABC transporter ATP-binding protein [Clostridia bacterium]|nr:ABC transporter ATP-binding protein [Clostridia bacterium]
MLKANNLCVTLGGKPVLENFSFFCEDVGCTALMGASGIGKTTFLRVLAGLIRPDSGEIESTFTRVSVKFQEPRLFDWLTVKQNVAAVLSGEEADSIAEKWLSAVGLEKHLHKYPHELSGGMAQRVALARALAYGGDLLLLDEPFSAVDEATKAPLLELIRAYAQSHAVILVTHSKEEAELLGAKIVQL